MMNEQQLAREKAAFIYSTALEDEDFTAVADVLAQAEQDPVLEQMLLEINAAWQSEMEDETMTLATQTKDTENGRAKTSWRRYLWPVGGAVALLVLVFGWLLTGGGLFGQPQVQDVEVTRVVTESPGYTNQYFSDSRTVPDLSFEALSYLFQRNAEDGVRDVVIPTAVPSQPNEPANSNAAQSIDRLIVRNGSMTVEVADPSAVRAQVEARVAAMAGDGAFVVSSEEYRRTNALPAVHMTIRIPTARFNETMNWLADTAVPDTIPHRTETAQDVTEEYVDLQARLESMTAARDRLLDIMENARTTEELLRIESQLTTREADIEALQGRMQYLQQAAALSLIEIQLDPYVLNQPFDNSWKPAETVRQAIESLLATSQNVADFLIVLVIAVLPWLMLLMLAGYLVIRFIWRPWQARRPE